MKQSKNRTLFWGGIRRDGRVIEVKGRFKMDAGNAAGTKGGPMLVEGSSKKV